MDDVEAAAAVPHPAPFRRIAGVAIVAVVLLVEVALFAAHAQLTGARDDMAEAEQLLLAFTDVQRGFQELELLAATQPSFAGAEVDTQLALLERQLRIAETHRDDPGSSPALIADVDEVVAGFDTLERIRATAPQDTAQAREVAARTQAVAQAAVDRTTTRVRRLFADDAVAAERTATVVAGVAGLVLVAGAVLVWAVLLRYQRSFDEAWHLATGRREQLELSNARLAALAETRERFVSVLSHELRTPLAVISAVGETLSNHGDQLDPATREGILRSLRRQVGRQQRMIDDLLLVARHANTDPDPQPTRVDLADLLSLVRHDEGLEGMLATFEVAPDTVAWADAHHLEQAIHNLLRNAQKYGGARVLVEARTEGDEVVLVVSDDGEGVPAHARETLFEPFTQGTGDKGGIGLGLSITRQLVEANGGRIDYRDGEGGGAVFELRMPRAAGAMA